MVHNSCKKRTNYSQNHAKNAPLRYCYAVTSHSFSLVFSHKSCTIFGAKLNSFSYSFTIVPQWFQPRFHSVSITKSIRKYSKFLIVSLTLNGDFALAFARVQSQKLTHFWVKNDSKVYQILVKSISFLYQKSYKF